MTTLGMGDAMDARTAHEDRNDVECPECGNTYERNGESLCSDCDTRLHPGCACGKCKVLAGSAFDIYADGELIERNSYFDEDHARGSWDPSCNVDIVELGSVASLVANGGKCWCWLELEQESDIYVGWCPHCGVRS